MSHPIRVALPCALAAALLAQPCRAQEPAGTPAEQYRALLNEQERASSPGRALTDDERLAFIGETYKKWDRIALRFVALAERHPDDPVALDALLRAAWQVNTTPWPVALVGRDEARPKAFALLGRDHLKSDRLGPLFDRIEFGYCAEYEAFLRDVLRESPHRAIRGRATLALANFLNNRLQRFDGLGDEPELAGQFEDLFGVEYVRAVRRRDRAEALREAEALFERAAAEFGELKLPDGTTIADRAAAGLFEIRNLVAGREAPEIEGEDQDGVRFRLSDYRGKVVLLDFWSEY